MPSIARWRPADLQPPGVEWAAISRVTPSGSLCEPLARLASDGNDPPGLHRKHLPFPDGRGLASSRTGTAADRGRPCRVEWRVGMGGIATDAGGRRSDG